ncbi:hypothetical protein B0A54_14838 [Friedmanniomyces endolithicus]|uniref:NAD-dependent epimerase/dehydratase domain-containing protein n=1 Tax=Friedmanniomyces endolithicus TaxID=329885 RepID=A0A4U0UEJ4_9PEZI|nr:hypothetical protein B0A54_14838 [Friedmanniomyces endolithicus]
MRRSYSYGSSSCPSASSPVSSRSSICEHDLDDDPVVLNASQTLDTRDYILVIGGLGFIGSHTTLELLKEGYNVVVVDNMSNSYDSAFINIQRLAKKHWASKGVACPHLRLHKIDYRSHMMRTILGRYTVQDAVLSSIRLSHITGVIHFAAYKSVEESTQRPLDYYQNNLAGLIDLLVVLGDFGIQNFVFSSSATVYGSVLSKGGKPVREEQLVHHEAEGVSRDTDCQAPPAIPGATGLTSPYGRTKYFSEAVLADVALADPTWRITALRYFNPVGCEPSGKLAEDPRQKPTNLFPVVSQVLKGDRPSLDIFGTDWNTRDGTAVRDYIHVVDLARGHLAALAAAGARPAEHAFRAYNLGTGEGSTVAQVVSCMEKAASRSIPVRQTGRRAGDVGFCVAATERAERELGWRTQLSKPQYDRDSYPIPPDPASASGAYNPNHFPPPPRSDYADSRGGYDEERGNERGSIVDDNPQAIAPYDEEKAWAQYNDAYGPPGGPHEYDDRQQRRPPPPPSSTVESGSRYGPRGSGRDYDDGGRSRYDDRDDRRRNRPSRYEEDEYDDYDDRDRDRDRDRRTFDHEPRRAPSDDDYRLRKHHSPTTTSKTGKDFLGQSDSERGLGATLLGGAAGAFLGDQADKGILGTVGGAVLGALAAKAGEKQIEKRQQKKEEGGKRRRDSDYVGSPDAYYGGGGGRGAERTRPSDMDSVDEFRPRREARRPERRSRRDDESDGYYSDERSAR